MKLPVSEVVERWRLSVSRGSGTSRTALLAQRFERAGTLVYTVAVPVGELGHILPIPDPDTPAPGNRRVSRPHARGFADYWCENSSWIAPPILVDTPYSLNQYFEPLAAAGAIVAGKIHLPSPQDSGLQILDGQHRVLGWDMVAMSSGAGASGEPLRHECVRVEILERVDLEEHQQYFFDFASNAKGITKSVTAGFDKRNMLHRAAQ